MTESHRLVFSRIIAAFISLIISFLSCYYVLDDMFIPSVVTDIGRLGFRFFVGYMLFLTLEWIQNRSMTKRKTRILYFLYTIMIISLLLSREKMQDSVVLYNFHFGLFKDASPVIPFINVIMYAPIGFISFDIAKAKRVFGVFASVSMVIVVELVQGLLRVGKFDVNDIILNISGVIIGCLAYHMLSKHITDHFGIFVIPPVVKTPNRRD